MKTPSQLVHMIRKEFLQVFRSRPMTAITLGMPVIQLMILGFAISGDVVHVPTLVTDLDNSQASRGLVERLDASPYLDIVYRNRDLNAVEPFLRRGDAILAVTIPRQFERDLLRGNKPQISLLADAQNTNTALTGASYARRIISVWAASELRGYGAPGMEIAVIEPVSRVWYNPALKNALYMVPGLMALLVTIITVFLTAMSIVRERGEQGTLEQLMVTPITRTALILGKTIPFLIIGLVEITLSLAVALTVYQLPFRGSVPLFYGLTVIYLFATLGIGMFVSTVSHTQQQALFTSWFVIIFGILMSGFMLPLENMPRAIYYLTYINPVRYYMTIVRELFLKGGGIGTLWPQALALAGLALGILTAAVARFHKRLD